MCNRSLLSCWEALGRAAAEGKYLSGLFYNSTIHHLSVLSSLPSTQVLSHAVSQLLICGMVFTIFWAFLVGMGM